MFLISELIFSKVAPVDSVDMVMPNIHYFVADLKKIGIPNSGEVMHYFVQQARPLALLLP